MRLFKWTALLMFAFALSASVSHACGNVVRLSKSKEVKALTAAERQLGTRDYAQTLNTLMGLYRYGPMSNRMKLGSSSPGLVRRARRIAAVAAIRTRGTRSLRFWNRDETDKKRVEKQIKWAYGQLKDALARTPDVPQRKSQFAEAQALIGERKAALTALEALAKDDLLVDAEAWALLAELRAEAGNADGAKAARTRCSAVAPDAPFCRPTI
jgi:predicted Zn-dependent protease